LSGSTKPDPRESPNRQRLKPVSTSRITAGLEARPYKASYKTKAFHESNYEPRYNYKPSDHSEIAK
jgi:hypothetical protein